MLANLKIDSSKNQKKNINDPQTNKPDGLNVGRKKEKYKKGK